MKQKRAEDLEYGELKDLIRALSKPQREALDRICCGDDSCVHPKTADALERKGLIVSLGLTMVGTFPVTVKRYALASIRVHMAWCEVAAEDYKEELD